MLARGRRRPATLLLPLALLVTACSGPDDTDAGRSDPATSPSGAASSPAAEGATATAERPPAAPRAARGPAGQRAFTRHVVALWAYALRTDDARPLAALAQRSRPCGGCAPLARTLRTRAAQHWSVDLPALDVRRVRTARQGALVVATAVVDVPESDSVFTDGRYRNTNPAHPGARFVVRLRWTDGAYRLVSFTLA